MADNTVSCEPKDLMENAACYRDCIPDGMKDAVIIYLLCKLIEAIEASQGE